MTARPPDARGPDSRRLTGAVLALALCVFVSVAAGGGIAALGHLLESSPGGTAGPAFSTSAAPPTRSGPSDTSFPSGVPSPSAVRPDASTGANASVANATTITNVTYGGPGPVTVANGTQYVWGSEPTTITVDYRIGGNDTSFVVSQSACLDFRTPAGNESRYTCVEGNNSRRTQSATFSLKRWPRSSNGAGPYTRPTVSVETSGVTDRAVLANRTLVAVSIAKGGDIDGDGLSNAAEVSHGTSLLNPDTDSDTLSDGAEVHTYHTDPTKKDTDGDGLSDPRELSLNTSPTNPDTDGDGLHDGAEVAFGSDPTKTDTDGDGLNDSVEHAIGTNPRNADTDGDGLSDATEYHVGLDPTSPLDVEVLGLLVVLSSAAGVVVLLRRGRPSAPAWLADVADGAAGDLDGAPRADGDNPSGALADPEPTTDRDRVLRLVEDAGGRIKQSRIVEETGWSKAKVSRLLSSMADHDDITKVRIGRENLICVEEEAPSRRRD